MAPDGGTPVAGDRWQQAEACHQERRLLSRDFLPLTPGKVMFSGPQQESNSSSSSGRKEVWGF